MSDRITDSPLGQKRAYIQHYEPSLLYPIPRSLGRDKLGLAGEVPFVGGDLWNGYELSWLDADGKPVVAAGRFLFPADSPHLVESKSFKLYLNSLNFHRFESLLEVQKTIQRDLERVIGAPIAVQLFERWRARLPIHSAPSEEGVISLDQLHVETNRYTVDPAALRTLGGEEVEERLSSDLLKSNCLVTGQPDWGRVEIRYRGLPIDKEGLLRYIISYRNHSGFAEMCVEKFFIDLMERCAPQQLMVSACYTPRGGLDICPYRSSDEQWGREWLRAFD